MVPAPITAAAGKSVRSGTRISLKGESTSMKAPRIMAASPAVVNRP